MLAEMLGYGAVQGAGAGAGKGRVSDRAHYNVGHEKMRKFHYHNLSAERRRIIGEGIPV